MTIVLMGIYVLNSSSTRIACPSFLYCLVYVLPAFKSKVLASTLPSLSI